jgi:hypothetical protein
MATPPLPEAVIVESLRVLAAHGGNVSQASVALGISRETLNGRVHIAKRRGIPMPQLPEPIIEVEPPQRPVVRVRAYNPLNAPDAPSRRVVVLGDSHWKPGMDFQHFKWIGRYITENQPENVVHIGDAFDFESCEFHTAPGSATHSRRPSFSEDIAAGEEALHIYSKELGVGEIPHDIVLGNHEYRVWRYEEAAPNLKDVLTLQLEQFFARYRWKTHEYRKWLFFEGVGITHAPQTIMQKPVGGKYPENSIGRDATFSIVFGHTHRWNHVTVPKIGDNNSITVTNVGCSMPYGYLAQYVNGATSGYTYGIADLTLRSGRVESASFISMHDLERRYK